MTETRPRHSWEQLGGGQRKCRSCGTVARRGSVPCGMPTAMEYHRNGQRMVSAHVPPCGEWEHQTSAPDVLQDLAEQADHAAGLAYRSGDLARASGLLADARVLAPDRAEHWAQRESQLRQAAARQTQDLPLAEQVSARLAAAGFTPESPEIQHIARWNAGARQREAG